MELRVVGALHHAERPRQPGPAAEVVGLHPEHRLERGDGPVGGRRILVGAEREEVQLAEQPVGRRRVGIAPDRLDGGFAGAVQILFPGAHRGERHERTGAFGVERRRPLVRVGGGGEFPRLFGRAPLAEHPVGLRHRVHRDRLPSRRDPQQEQRQARHDRRIIGSGSVPEVPDSG